MKLTTALPLWARTVIALLATFGLLGVVPVSLAELRTGNGCPSLGPIPACHIVTISYGLILAAALSSRLWSLGLFYLGWVPVFLLAAGGSFFEFLGQNVCPQTEGGWPKCYFSLGLALAIATPLLVYFFKPRQKS